MATLSFSKDTLNFLKYTVIVMDELPNALRQIFINMWDKDYGSRPGYQFWDDSPAVRNMLLRNEGSKTAIPTSRSIQEWDCTALFKATIYARSFSVTDATGNKKSLNDMYLRKSVHATTSFHTSVASTTGDQNETYALLIDQLRLLRNTLCHSASCELDKVKFDQYVLLAKDAFNAASIDTSTLEAIGSLSESDFPLEKVRKLEEYIRKIKQETDAEIQENHQFLKEEVKDCLFEIKLGIKEMKQQQEEMGRRISKSSLGDIGSEGETSYQRSERRETRMTREYQELSQKVEADFLHKKGKEQCSIGNYEEALRLHREALSIRLNMDETIHKGTTAISYREIGKIHYLLREYRLALLSFEASLDILMNSAVYGEQHSETARGYYHVGEARFCLRNYPSALYSLRKSLDIWKIQGGHFRKEIANVYRTMGVVQTRLGDYTHANESLESSLEILQQLYAANHPNIAATCYEFGKLRSAQQQYDLSSKAFNISLKITEQIYGKASLESVSIHTEIGRLQTRIGNYENAIRSHQQALEIVLEKQHNGVDKYERVSNCHRDIAKTHSANRDFESALHSYQSALDSITDNVDAVRSRAMCADIYSEIAYVHYRKREYDLALEKYEQSLKIDSNNVACSISIGHVYSTIRDYKSELEAYKRSLVIVRNRGNNWENRDETATIYSKIGNAQLHLGNYDESLESLQSSLAITKKLHGEDHEKSAVVYDYIARVYFCKRSYAYAIRLYKRSLNIRMKLPNRKEEVIAKSHFNIGRIPSLVGNYAAAPEPHLKSLQLRRMIHGDKHEVTAESYFEVGRTQQGLCNYSSSIEMYRKAISIGPEYHPRTAACYSYIGVMQSVHRMGGHAEALKSHERALEIRREVHGEQHQDTLLSYCYVGRTQLAQENNRSALHSYERALAINTTLLRNGEESMETAEIYFHIGMAEFNMEHYRSAIRTHTMFLEIRKTVLSKSTTNGDEEFASLSRLLLGQGITTRAGLERISDIKRISDIEVAMSYSQIGTAQALDYDYQSALESHQHAYDIRRRIYGEDHEDTLDSYKSLQLMKSFLARKEKKNS